MVDALNQGETEPCPLLPVERRLEDCHRQWHEAEQAYFDPDEFRFRIQTCISTLRTVTFILQKLGKRIPDFEKWYGKWRDRLRDDSLMKWMVDARNRIEKEGDLELHSLVRAELIASYLDGGPTLDVPAELFEGPAKLLSKIPENAVGKHVKENGVLRIQRRWVENSLPELELLEAVSVAYGHISELVDDAHLQLGDRHRGVINNTTGETIVVGDRQGRLPCMIGHEAERTLLLRVKDGARLTIETGRIAIRPEDEQRIAEHFPVSADEVFAARGAPLEEQLSSLFSTARTVFGKDGYHVTVSFLFRGPELIDLFELRPEDQGEKYVMMRHVAREVSRSGADAVIMLGELWSARFDPEHPLRRPFDAPDRTEQLSATLVRKNGDPIQLFAEIIRERDRATLGATTEIRNAAIWSYAPVYAAWKRDIPANWKDPGAEAVARE